MKELLYILFVALAISVFGRDVSAQPGGLPNDDRGDHSRMDPWYPEQWGRNPPQGSSGTASGFATREKPVITKGPLAPPQNDRSTYAAFLRMNATGLMRLRPRENFGNDPDSLRGGAYYSFGGITHSPASGSDLELFNHALSVGFVGADFGMLTFVDRPLEQIAWGDPDLRYISAYKPPTAEGDARLEHRLFRLGVTNDGQLYRSRLPVVVNSTYLLRSVRYGRSDVLVAFRIVSKETDGSVIILWKLLKQYPTPKLARA
jgi:hypothetical protein